MQRSYLSCSSTTIFSRAAATQSITTSSFQAFDYTMASSGGGGGGSLSRASSTSSLRHEPPDHHASHAVGSDDEDSDGRSATSLSYKERRREAHTQVNKRLT